MDVERGVPVVHEKDFDGDPVEDGGAGEIRIIIYFKYGKRGKIVNFSPFICFVRNIQLCFFISVYKSN